MSFRPAGLSDDDESEFDYYGDSCSEALNLKSEAESEDNRGLESPWVPTRCQSPTPEDNIIAASKDIFRFADLVVSNDVEGVQECLKRNQTFLDENFESNSIFSTSGGCRIIFLACSSGLPQMVSMLLELGCSLDPNPVDQFTPLMAVCSATCNITRDMEEFEKDLEQCAELLISSGKVDVNSRQSHRMTALMFASKNGYDLLAKLLIQNGAQLDATDTQNWTALAFAVDAGFGNVARTLLEAGANPDIATFDGPLPVDLALYKNNEKLAAVIKSYARRSELPIFETSDTCIVQKFTDLDNILMGLNASEYIPLFKHHKINLELFLQLTENDLEKMGIEKVGIRKNLAKGIVDIHNKEWDKSSLSQISPKDRQNGIYLTCPDAVLQLANMSQHFRFLSANLQFIKRQLKDKPEMLLVGKDIADASHLMNRICEAKANLATTSSQLQQVESGVREASKILGVELAAVDSFSKAAKTRNFFIASSTLVTASILILGVLFTRKFLK